MKIADKNYSAEDAVRKALEKAKDFEEYNVFTEIFADRALAQAKIIDEKIKNNEPVGKLAGVPFALKDLFLTKTGHTTASAHILEPFESPLNATIVEQLEAEGAICIGKTNMDAFAQGSSTENSYFGPTLNAVDKTRVAGGSSGGSAVAVALDIVEFAVGSDTGGSIRQPASFNGVFGLKPTYGATSRYGAVAMASSFDTMGFFTRTAEDLNLLMEICAHRDRKDLMTLPDFYENSEAGTVKKIGIIRDFDNESVNPDVRRAMENTVSKLKNKGIEIVELEMPVLKYVLPVYYIIQPAEVASNLSRYDGIRYGFRSEKSGTLDELFESTRSEGFMPENKRRIMIGNFVLSSGSYDAYFLKAAKARTLIVRAYEKAFLECDLILAPVAPNPAFKLGEKVNDPVAMYLEDVMTVPINLTGLPALSVPVYETENKLPVGLQLVGPRKSDKKIINFAKELM